MSLKNKFINEIKEFLEDDNKKTVIITGYINTPKLYLTLSILNNYFNNGILYTNGIQNFKDLVNDHGRYNLISRKIKQDEFFRLNHLYLNDMQVKISLFTKNYKFNYDNDTFSVYFPIGNATLKNSKSNQQLFENISNNQSKKIFIITVSDWAVDKSEFQSICDSIIYYDIKEDYPDRYQSLISNTKGETLF